LKEQLAELQDGFVRLVRSASLDKASGTKHFPLGLHFPPTKGDGDDLGRRPVSQDPAEMSVGGEGLSFQPSWHCGRWNPTVQQLRKQPQKMQSPQERPGLGTNHCIPFFYRADEHDDIIV
uniref:Uncharacterized protein n=1 Tax=Oryctolagus cuniculus TaxID=9986 RepID=A0A5F9CUQ7_RABIT